MFPAAAWAAVEVALDELSLEAVFPVLYGHYRECPVGRVSVRNTGDSRAEDVRVTVHVPGYMEAASGQAEPFTLEPGKQRQVDLTMRFDKRILELTRPALVPVEVRVEYQAGGGRREQLKVASLRMWDRNAVSWEDPRAAAAFVTTRDPLVESSSRTAGAREQRFSMLNDNLVAAMGLYYALAQAGICREADSGLPCAGLAGPRGEVDRLRFPRETLLERTADCAEIEILYCTMLESLGVESALVMVPERIYPAFSLGWGPLRREGCSGGQRS